MVILNFHGIGEAARPLEPSERSVWVTQCVFECIVEAVKHRSDIAFTFDDGNSSDVAIALPVLRRHGLVAEFFPCAGRVGLRSFLSESDVRELCRQGMAIGSHGWSHVSWRGLSSEEASREWRDAIAKLSDVVQGPIRSAACPFGAYDRGVLRAARASGMERLYTSDRAKAQPRQFVTPRYTIHAWDTPESVRGIVDGRPGWLRASRQRVVSAAKRLR